MVSFVTIDEKTGLYLNALPAITSRAFLRCTTMPLFANGEWYLAGGTALALQVGHRQSVDLDFFTPERTFDEQKTEVGLQATEMWETSSRSDGTLYGTFARAKMSLIAYPFFKPALATLKIGTVNLLRPQDIAAMKIVAISQRGRKRDFVDLYWLSKNIQPLAESFEHALAQYTARQNPSHMVKSMVYFEDAEQDPMPTLLFNATWENIKKYFQTEVPQIAKKLIGLK